MFVRAGLRFGRQTSMATLNYATREITCKIVYYGTSFGGKTTNLQQIHASVSPEHRGDLISLATDQERTLFFDFLPLDLGRVQGLTTKFQLYTVPGQVYYSATRKLVLRGVDGLVFVADSKASRIAENKESLQDLRENLAEYGFQLEEMPWVIQYNKRDLPDAMAIEALQRELNPLGVPHAEAVASEGRGVKETLRLIAANVLENLSQGRASAAPPPSASPIAAPAASPKPAAPSPPPKPSGPGRVALRQRCDVYWNSRKIGHSILEFKPRENTDGLGDYQLAENTRLMLGFKRVHFHPLRYVADGAIQARGAKSGVYVFEGGNSGKGSPAALRVWVEKSSPSRIVVCRPAPMAGEWRFVPEGQPDLAAAP